MNEYQVAVIAVGRREPHAKDAKDAKDAKKKRSFGVLGDLCVLGVRFASNSEISRRAG